LIDLACVLCRKSTDLSWEGDEPAAAVAEEEAAPPAEESAPAPQAEPEAPNAEATLPEASIVEGEYSAEVEVPSRIVVVAMLTDTLVFLSTGAEAEGSEIPSAVPVEDVALETQEAAVEAPEPMEVATGEAAATAGEEDAALPEPALEVAVRSPEIQDAEPIRSTPMTEAATNSRGGIELLADDLVDPTTVARHLEAVRQAEQWMKVSSHNP
jgi:hypothetical protein